MTDRVFLLRLIFTGSLFFVSSPACAQKAVTGAVLMREPFGARPFALGSAYSALGADIFGLSYNPAILSRMSDSQVATQFTQSAAETQLGFLGLATPLNANQALGLTAAYLDGGRTDAFDANGLKTGNINVEKDYLIGLGYAYSMRPNSGRLHLGATGKILRSALAENSNASAYAADAGGLYEWPSRQGLASVAVAFLNLGPGIRYAGGLSSGSQFNPLPLTYRAGAAYIKEVFKNDSVSAGAQLDRTPFDNGLFASAGLEYDYHRLCALRFGYRHGENTRQFTVGMGLSFRGLSLDYGIGVAQALGSAYKMSLNYRFAIPGIRYGKPYLAGPSAAETMAKRAQELIAKKRYFDAYAESLKLQAFFPQEASELQSRILREMEAAAGQGRGSPLWNYAMGFHYFRQRQWADAAASLESGLRQEPGNEEISSHLDLARRRLREEAQKKRIEQEARIGTLFDLANQAFEDGDYSRAARIIKEILNLGPYRPAESLRRKIAEARAKPRSKPRPKPRPRRRIASAVSKPSPQAVEKSEELYTEAMKAYLQGNLAPARSILMEALKLNPTDENMRNFLASLERAIQKHGSSP